MQAGRHIAGNSERFIYSVKRSARNLIVPSSCEMVAGILSVGLKRTVYEADHSPATTAEVQSYKSSTISLTKGRGRTVPTDLLTRHSTYGHQVCRWEVAVW